MGMFLYPGRKFHYNGRRRVLSVVRRIAIGGVNLENRLPDILLADAFTSYSKTFVDVAIMICMLFSGKSCVGTPDRACGGEFLVPVVAAIPSLIRIRQCTIDFSATGNKVHLFNVMKYASGLPVVFFSALQRTTFKTTEQPIFSDQGLVNMWVFSVFINSTYTFIWDVTFDWELDLLKSVRSFKHGGLRPVLYFSSRYWYYGAITVDYTLRFTWSILRLSPNWTSYSDFESGMFVLGLVEITRRWIWVFFRVEAEWVRSLRDPLHAQKGPNALPLMESRAD
jgi:hypothetical protein